MLYFAFKIGLSALIVAITSELARRSTTFAALIISLPILSILAFSWVYYESKDTQRIIDLSYSTCWLVLPSLSFFLILPLCLKNGISFPLAMIISIFGTGIIYSVSFSLQRFLS